MTESEAKGIVTVSMIWLGVLIVASQNWSSSIVRDIASKAGGPNASAPATPPVLPTPAPAQTPTVLPSPIPAPNPIPVFNPAPIPPEFIPAPSPPMPQDPISGLVNEIGGFAKWIGNGVVGIAGLRL